VTNEEDVPLAHALEGTTMKLIGSLVASFIEAAGFSQET
jgi:hypothetical protein